jgi:hypothetical protein
LIICEHCGWSYKHPIFDNGWFVDKGIILNFAVLAEGDTGAYISPTTYYATFSEYCIFTNLRVMPDFCIVAGRNPISNIS